MKLLRTSIRALAAAAMITTALVSAPAAAAPVVFAATLNPGVTTIGSANHAPGGAFSAPDLWTFFKFNAEVNQPIDVTVRRTDGRLDPFFGVWFGQEADTGAYFDMVSSSQSTSWMGFADDELPPAQPGSAGDANLDFTAPGSGPFVIAVAGLSSTAGSLPNSFAITVAVPEPSTYAMLSLGLGALAFRMRRRRSEIRLG